MPRRDRLDSELTGHEPADYEQHAEAPAFSAGIGHPAGIYWLAGRCLIVGHGTSAEVRVREGGGILVATLRFGPSPYETRRPRSVLRRVAPRRAMEDPHSRN